MSKGWTAVLGGILGAILFYAGIAKMTSLGDFVSAIPFATAYPTGARMMAAFIVAVEVVLGLQILGRPRCHDMAVLSTGLFGIFFIYALASLNGAFYQTISGTGCSCFGPGPAWLTDASRLSHVIRNSGFAVLAVLHFFLTRTGKSLSSGQRDGR